MSAIRVARAYTGRDLIVKYARLLSTATQIICSSRPALASRRSASRRPPVSRPLSSNALCVIPLDDEAALQELFTKEGSRIAAVIIEPTPANHGLLLQRKEYLEKLRAVTKQHGALLIFDEVISSFRVARGGVSQLTGIQPDLATFGKIIGGGMPVGAFGGSRKIMSRLAPEGDTYQAGTLSGNPVAMSAGVAALDALIRDNAWAKLETLGARARTHGCTGDCEGAIPGPVRAFRFAVLARAS